MTKSQKCLVTWERKILRRIYELVYENISWSVGTNKETRNKYNSHYIMAILKSMNSHKRGM
mgnify:CR=1 FL=1